MISIILPVYNVEKYIRQCLDSILNQTYKDYQLIVIDDGSTDRSLEIVYEYENKFNNIVILKQSNKGASEARNLAMKYVEGNYTLFIDSDDFLDKNMLKIMNENAERYMAEVIICEYYFYYGENSDKNHTQKYEISEGKVYNSYEIMNLMLEDTLQGQLWHKMFSTNLLKRSSFKLEPGRYIEDIFPVFKAISLSKGIVFVKKPLYFYRQRATSLVHKKNMKMAEDFFCATKSIMDYISCNNIVVNASSLKKFYCITLNKFIGFYISADKNNNEKTFNRSKYSCLKIPSYKMIFLKKVSIKIKLKILIWNIGLYKIYKIIMDKIGDKKLCGI